MLKTTSREENYEHVLMCLICRSLFDDHDHQPKFLPCHHTFCKDCLREYVHQMGDEIECPSCRKLANIPAAGVAALQTNFYVKYIQSLVSGIGVYDNNERGFCLIHNDKKIQVYCQNCKQSICDDCIDNCKPHSKIPITTLTEESHLKLDSAFSSANNTIENKKVQIDTLLKVMSEEKDQALKKIDSSFEQNVHTLNRRATLLKNKVIDIYKENVDKLESDMEEIATAFTCIASLKDYHENKISHAYFEDITKGIDDINDVQKNINNNIRPCENHILYEEEHGSDRYKASIKDLGRVRATRPMHPRTEPEGNDSENAFKNGQNSNQTPFYENANEIPTPLEEHPVEKEPIKNSPPKRTGSLKKMSYSTQSQKKMNSSTESEKKMNSSTESEKKMNSSTESEKKMNNSTESQKNMNNSTESQKNMNTSIESLKKMNTSTESQKKMNTSTESQKMNTSTESQKKMNTSTESQKKMNSSTESQKKMNTSTSSLEKSFIASEKENMSRSSSPADLKAGCSFIPRFNSSSKQNTNTKPAHQNSSTMKNSKNRRNIRGMYTGGHLALGNKNSKLVKPTPPSHLALSHVTVDPNANDTAIEDDLSDFEYKESINGNTSPKLKTDTNYYQMVYTSYDEEELLNEIKQGNFSFDDSDSWKTMSSSEETPPTDVMINEKDESVTNV